MKEYKEWILAYLLIILIACGLFCLGIILMAPCQHAF